jgi:hypothetical protein
MKNKEITCVDCIHYGVGTSNTYGYNYFHHCPMNDLTHRPPAKECPCFSNKKVCKSSEIKEFSDIS